jgi:hypothetical protein
MTKTFAPHFDILPLAQKELWKELHTTPDHFTLYGGTALALYLGHRKSVDFDFFSRAPFEAADLLKSVPYLAGAERTEISKNSLTCWVDRGGKVKLQFFGDLPLGSVKPREQPTGAGFWVASLLDVAGIKVKVLPDRAEEKDYIDVDALLKHGIELTTMLAAAKAIYGPAYNPLLSLKALTFYTDVPQLSEGIKKRLSKASLAVDLSKLPVLKPLPVQPTMESQP